jgi:hypothetical protein
MDDNDTRKKKYEKPQITRITLDAQTAVLGFCKGAAGGGPVQNSCEDALGDNCLSQGS